MFDNLVQCHIIEKIRGMAGWIKGTYMDPETVAFGNTTNVVINFNTVNIAPSGLMVGKGRAATATDVEHLYPRRNPLGRRSCFTIEPSDQSRGKLEGAKGLWIEASTRVMDGIKRF